jgi:periplasmic protein TonB
MFEQSLVTSAVSGGRGWSRKSWIVMASLGVEAGLVAAFVVVPLLWPATLPPSALRPRLTSVSLAKPEVKVQPKPEMARTASANAMSVPTRTTYVEQAHGGTLRQLTIQPIGDDPPVLMTGTNMGGPGPLVGMGVGTGSGLAVRVSLAPAKKEESTRVSEGVMLGRLLAPITPVYPKIAIAVRQEGVVVVTAVIDKNGRIVGAKALSGPPMLTGAAVDAVKEARYKPYLLNGEPTDVVTTITVNFRLGS